MSIATVTVGKGNLGNLSAKFSRLAIGNARTFVLGSRHLSDAAAKDIDERFDSECDRATAKYLAMFGPSAIEDLRLMSSRDVGDLSEAELLRWSLRHLKEPGASCRREYRYRLAANQR